MVYTPPADLTGKATGTVQIPKLVQKSYSQLFDWAFRSQVLFRDYITKRPVALTNPGETVVLSMFKDMAPAITELSQYVDPEPAVLQDATQVEVTVKSWGNWTVHTERAAFVSLANIDEYAALSIANNSRDSLDILAQPNFQGGVNVYTVNNSGVVSKLANGSKISNIAGGAASGVNAIPATNLFKASLLRTGVTKLRGSSVPWTFADGLYTCIAHPDVCIDLRADTGPAGWRQPHEYSAVGEIWKGVTGTFEGAGFVESPRCFSAQDGAGTAPNQAKLYESYLLGWQAVAEATLLEPTFVAKPMDDALDRFTRVGWKAMMGWNKYRPESLVNFVTSSSMAGM